MRAVYALRLLGLIACSSWGIVRVSVAVEDSLYCFDQIDVVVEVDAGNVVM